MAVSLYRQVKTEKGRRYQKVNLGPGRRPNDLKGPYVLRYYCPLRSKRLWESVGDDLTVACDVMNQKEAYLVAIAANVPVVVDREDKKRTKIADAVNEFLNELQIFKGKDNQGKSLRTIEAYRWRLGLFLAFCEQEDKRFSDQIDRKVLLSYIVFLQEHENDFSDRTVHNIFETCNTLLRARDIYIAGKILANLDFSEKPVKPYTKGELEGLFEVSDENESLWISFFLQSGCRKGEVANTEYADLDFEKNVLHVQPKPWRKFRLKGKKKDKSAKDRFVPIPTNLVQKLRMRMEVNKAGEHDLVFPNGNNRPEHHFWRMLQAIANRANVKDANLHRLRKTFATTHHEDGVSLNTLREWLGHESLEVTRAYLKGCDAGSEEAQAQVNNGSLARFA